MQRCALTHILFPGGAALGCLREMSSLAGVDRVCTGIMRGRKKKPRKAQHQQLTTHEKAS